MEQSKRMQDLAMALEQLWKFYEAMHSGKPLNDGDEALKRIGLALRNSAGKTQEAAILSEGRVGQAVLGSPLRANRL